MKNHLGKIIENKCMMQSKIARKLGITTQYFNDMVKGRRVIPTKVLLKLEIILDTPANQIIELEESDWAPE